MSLEVQARASPLGLGVYLGSQPNAKPYQAARHLIALNAAILEAVHGARRRLIVSFPPQHGKSRLVSVLTPAWFLGTFPNRSVLLASYASKLAKFLGRQSRQIVERTGRETYEVEVDTDAQAAGEWRLGGFEGGMVSAGVAGDFRGRAGDLVIVDDPIKDSKQALSPGYLDGLWDWFTSVLEGRLAQDATVIVCATRLNERDLSGRLIAEFGDEWDVLRLPAIAEADDPLGRNVGEALWPERYDAEYLAKRKRRVGSFWWQAEYQQRPTPAEGNIINRAWFRFWRAGRLPKMDATIQSWDMNLKETKSGSYASGQTWGRSGADRYLLARARGRWGFEELLRQFALMVKRHPGAGRKLVEPTAAGPAAVSMLKRRFTGVLEAPAPKGSKVARMRAVAPAIESGNVYLPHPDDEGNGWVREFMDAIVTFPNGDGSDDGDALSQALAHFDQASQATVETSASARNRDRRQARRPFMADRPRIPNAGRVNLWGDGGVLDRGRIR